LNEKCFRKFVEKIKTHIFVQELFFSKIVRLSDKVQKMLYSGAGRK